MAEPGAIHGEVARMHDLPMLIATARQCVEKRLAIPVLQPGLNTQGAVVKRVEFARVAKHLLVMHLAFDKGKPTP